MSLKKKIIYKSKHRATKELDIILGNFVGQIIDNINDTELLQLEELVNIEDQKLFDYIFKKFPLENSKSNPMLEIFVTFYSKYVQSS